MQYVVIVDTLTSTAAFVEASSPEEAETLALSAPKWHLTREPKTRVQYDPFGNVTKNTQRFYSEPGTGTE